MPILCDMEEDRKQAYHQTNFLKKVKLAHGDDKYRKNLVPKKFFVSKTGAQIECQAPDYNIWIASS